MIDVTELKELDKAVSFGFPKQNLKYRARLLNLQFHVFFRAEHKSNIHFEQKCEIYVLFRAKPESNSNRA